MAKQVSGLELFLRQYSVALIERAKSNLLAKIFCTLLNKDRYLNSTYRIVISTLTKTYNV